MSTACGRGGLGTADIGGGSTGRSARGPSRFGRLGRQARRGRISTRRGQLGRHGRRCRDCAGVAQVHRKIIAVCGRVQVSKQLRGDDWRHPPRPMQGAEQGQRALIPSGHTGGRQLAQVLGREQLERRLGVAAVVIAVG